MQPNVTAGRALAWPEPGQQSGPGPRSLRVRGAAEPAVSQSTGRPKKRSSGTRTRPRGRLKRTWQRAKPGPGGAHWY